MSFISAIIVFFGSMYYVGKMTKKGKNYKRQIFCTKIQSFKSSLSIFHIITRSWPIYLYVCVFFLHLGFKKCMVLFTQYMLKFFL